MKWKGRGKMNANINYIGILNMLRYLEEKGAITKAEEIPKCFLRIRRIGVVRIAPP